MSEPAPLVVFVYNRPWHTHQVIKSLLENNLSADSELFIYADAARSEADLSAVRQVRDYINSVSGFKSIKIMERDRNWGLANSIIDGVTRVVNEYGRVIVVEDDLVTSPYFLTYMNEALERYADDDRVISVHGYVYPVDQELPEAFFLPGADCWGWATWQRGWALFESDGQKLLGELQRRKLMKEFDYNDSYPYSEMLQKQIRGSNDSWAVRWYASAFLAEKLTLYPGRSLVHNIGNDSSGTHCGDSISMDSELSQTPINLSNVPVVASERGRRAFENFFRKTNQGLMHRAMRKAGSMLKRLVT